MNFAIVIIGAPYSTQAPFSALQFSKSAIELGHQISRVFLYRDGVHLSTKLAAPPQDEFDVYKAWQELIETHNIEVVTCIGAAARRGLIDESESARHNKSANNMSEAFVLSGLGQLIEASITADRVITFGA